MRSSPTSRIPGFYRLSIAERLARLATQAGVEQKVLAALRTPGGIDPEHADHMVENVVGVFGLPLGIATNFQVNGREVLVPMVIEEPSVVAGASFMAKLARAGGGFHAHSDEALMIGQIQILDVPDIERAKKALEEHKEELLAEADACDPLLLQLGGGARDLEIRLLDDTPANAMLIVHLLIDTRDAMGANTVNTAAERLGPRIADLTGGRVRLQILSNLADRRLAAATCRIPIAELAFGQFSGEEVARGIIEAWAFAAADPYRAATHNKGIMNGVDAVVIATGNDWRAVEAGAHAYAARSGRYTSLSRWSLDGDEALVGELELPLALGIVGGATRVHPLAQANLAVMGVESSRELAEVTVSVGLAQNLAALRALASEGIQRGHMTLHARQVAVSAGARGDQVERIAEAMVREGTIHIERAQELLARDTPRASGNSEER